MKFCQIYNSPLEPKAVNEFRAGMVKGDRKMSETIIGTISLAFGIVELLRAVEEVVWA